MVKRAIITAEELSEEDSGNLVVHRFDEVGVVDSSNNMVSGGGEFEREEMSEEVPVIARGESRRYEPAQSSGEGQEVDDEGAGEDLPLVSVPLVPVGGWVEKKYRSSLTSDECWSFVDSLKGRLDTTMYTPFVPELGRSATEMQSNEVFLYQFQFKAGLHLPLHPFFCTCLSGWGVGPAQLGGNAWAKLVSYFIFCERKGWPQSFNVIKKLYKLIMGRLG